MELMHARTIALRPREGRFDQVTRVLKERILKERTLGKTQGRPGFLGSVVMCDRRGGKIVSNTYWDTEADNMLFGEAPSTYIPTGPVQQRRRAAQRGPPPVVEHFEVEMLS